MKIAQPDYFETFQCLAGKCPDSCCHEWEIQVEQSAAEFYRGLPGELGDRLRKALVDRDGETVLELEDERCPMWRKDGLCAIQAELGHDALCRTCREFPRITHDYGDFQERQLELSCPEAARWILESGEDRWVEQTIPGDGEGEYDGEAMEILLAGRKHALKLLEDSRWSVGERLTLMLIWGREVQAALDEGRMPEALPEDILEQAARLGGDGRMEGILDCFRGLEILTARWRQRLDHPRPGPWEPGHLALARYLIRRYWLQAVSDYDLNSRVTLTLVSCLLVRELGGDLVSTAQLFSKEIENSGENLDALLDAAYENPAFCDENLLGLLNP